MDKVQIFQWRTYVDFRGQLKYLSDLFIDGVQRIYSGYQLDSMQLPLSVSGIEVETLRRRQADIWPNWTKFDK